MDSGIIAVSGFACLFFLTLVCGGKAGRPAINLGEMGKVVIPQLGGNHAHRQGGGSQQKLCGFYLALGYVFFEGYSAFIFEQAGEIIRVHEE